MEIYQLRTFLVVARCQHLTRAGEQLHLSQPAVSKQIKALEDELGVTLFNRTTAGVLLTRVGNALLPLVEQTLAAATTLTSTAARLRGEVAGRVRLGTIVDPESLGFADFLAQMVRWHPMIELKLRHGISGEILELIQAGELDAGYYLGQVTEPGIGVLELRKVEYVIIGPAAWAPRIEQASLGELAGMPWVAPNPASSQHRIATDLFANAGLPHPLRAIEVDQESSMISLVRSGVGLCLMREEIIREAADRGEVVIWRGAIPLCPLSFIHLRSRADEAPIAAMLDVLRLHRRIDPAA